MDTKKFLEFNGTNLYFLNSDGTYYIAYKPICDALKLSASRCYKNLKNHPIFGPALAILPMQVQNKGIIQHRNMTCIPEKYVYFWLATINSENVNLIKFQLECAEILMNHFRGFITNRDNLLEQKMEVDYELSQIEKKLQLDENFIKLNTLKKKQSSINKELKKSDDKIIKEKITLFNYNDN